MARYRTSLFKKGDRDENEKMFTNLLDRYHIEYSRGAPGDGYDLLVQTRPMQLWEIKNPETRWSLTKAEQAKREYCRAHGIPYHVIEHLEQAVEAITKGAKNDN